MIELYEKNQIKVDEKLIEQYIQHKKTAKDFSVYYDLFNKYRSDYQIDKILEGIYSEEIKNRAKNAKFDERLSLLGLITDSVTSYLKETIETDETISGIFEILKAIKSEAESSNKSISELLERHILRRKDILDKGKKSSSLSYEKQNVLLRIIAVLEKENLLISGESDKEIAFGYLKEAFAKMISSAKINAEESGKKLSNAFKFLEEVFPESQEILIFVTELTVNYYDAKFISRYGCEEYYKHNKELLFYERQQEILAEIENFDL